jgi:hypothetical protein
MHAAPHDVPRDASRARAAGTRRDPLPIGWAITALVFVLSTAWAREHLLDDAFIHLRYLRHLIASGVLAFNEGAPSHGTSSLSWIRVLEALLAPVPTAAWPTATKVISVAAHALAVVLVWRAPVGLPRRSRMIALGLGLTLALPTTARWLQDGMETSLAVLVSMLAAALACGWRRRGDVPSPTTVVLVGVAAGLPGWLRVDLVPVSAAALALVVLHARPRRAAVVAVAALIVLAGAADLLATSGHLLSDAAIAKRRGQVDVRFPLDAAIALGSVSPFWAAAPLVAVMAARGASLRTRLALSLALAPFVLVIAAGTAVGQFIHGARYFLPHLAFAWTALVWLVADAPAWRPRAIAVGALAALGVVHVAALAPRLAPTLRRAWLDVSVPAVASAEVIGAHDVGRLGWALPVPIADFAGLVNGRDVALARGDARECTAIETAGVPDVLVLTASQAPAHGDLRLPCAGGLRYAGPGPVVMELENLGGALQWHAWTRVR